MLFQTSDSEWSVGDSGKGELNNKLKLFVQRRSGKNVEPIQTPDMDPFARMTRTNSEKCNKLQTFTWHENHVQESLR